jgi:S-adenosylmethionine:tRNA ribosyltransferase-isomerase
VTAASWPRGEPGLDRLLHLDPRTHRRRDLHVADLAGLLAPGDLVVVNDSATLPASLRGRLGDLPVELRLAAERAPGLWDAVLFGAGDWRTRTEDRPAPPVARPGDGLALGPELAARVEAVSPISRRLLTVRFEQPADVFWPALYRHGRPVQYAYAAGPLELWHTQTPYAARPWSVEAPSAGRPLEPSLLGALARRGVALATLTHAAGLSSTGDAALDRALPLPERYDVPASTVAAVAAARARGGRVVAVGTTVVRALEGAAHAHGRLAAGGGVTDLRIGAGFRPAVADGIFTGMHEPEASHFSLLEAFAPRALLAEAHAHAEAEGYLAHEFGDSMLILPARGEPPRA